MITAAQLVAKVTADTTQAEAGLGGITGLLGKALPLAAAGGALAVVGIGLAATKMAGDFQANMTTLVTGAGEDQKKIGMVSQGILQMARDTGTSTDQLISGMFMVESAGHHAADGLNVLKVAAQGAKVGNADLGVTADALTTILADYPGVINGATGAMNTLTATVSSGKTHMQDLASSLASILPTSAAAHVGLNDVMGAMATMTGEGVPAANAATYLRQTILALDAPGKLAQSTLKSIGLTSKEVANGMSIDLPATLQMITEHLAKKFPQGAALAQREMLKVQSGTETFDQALAHLGNTGASSYIDALKNIAGGSKTMQGLLDLTGDHLQTFKDNVGLVSKAVKEGGNSVTGWSDVQGDFNTKMDRAKQVVNTLMIELGTKLLPVAGQIVDVLSSHLIPAVSLAGNVISGTVTTVQNIVGWYKQWQPQVNSVAIVITAIFTPALIESGVQATIAGAKMAASFVANVVKSGAEAANSVVKLVQYNAQLVASGVQATLSGAKIAASWVASTVQAGAQAVVAGAKITGTYIASMVQAGAASVAQGARIVGSAVASFVMTQVQAARTGATMLAELIPAIVSSGASFVTFAAVSIASTISAFIAYIPIALSAAVATIAAAAPFILVGLAIAGFIAIIVLLVTHWKDLTNWLGHLGFIEDAGAAFHKFGDLVGNVASGLGTAFKTGINDVIGFINSFIHFLDGIQIHIPAVGVGPVHSPSFDWNGMGIPTIPLLAEGGDVLPGGDAIVGDAGMEHLHVTNRGARVTPLPGSARVNAAQANQPIIIHLHNYLDGRQVAEIVVPYVPAVVRHATGVRGM